MYGWCVEGVEGLWLVWEVFIEVPWVSCTLFLVFMLYCHGKVNKGLYTR